MSINGSAGGHPHGTTAALYRVYTQDGDTLDGDTHSSHFVILQCSAIVFHGVDVWI